MKAWRRVNGLPHYCDDCRCDDCIYFYDGSICESEEAWRKKMQEAREKKND